MAPAKHTGHGLLDLHVAGFRISIEERLRSEDHAVHTEPALHGLFIDKRLLNRMRFLDRSESLERRDFRSDCATHRRLARPHRLAAENYRAGSTLSEATTKLRAPKGQVVAQDVKQRRGRVHVYGERSAA